MNKLLFPVLFLVCFAVGYGQDDILTDFRRAQRAPLKGIKGVSVSAAVIDLRKIESWDAVAAGMKRLAISMLREKEVPLTEPDVLANHDERGLLIMDLLVDETTKGSGVFACRFKVTLHATMKSPRTGRQESIPVWESTKTAYLVGRDGVILDSLSDILKDFAFDFAKAQVDELPPSR
jgi:hypothetical protein